MIELFVPLRGPLTKFAGVLICFWVDFFSANLAFWKRTLQLTRDSLIEGATNFTFHDLKFRSLFELCYGLRLSEICGGRTGLEGSVVAHVGEEQGLSQEFDET